MRLRPASFLWLLRHELRLAFRSRFNMSGTMLALLGALWLLLHAVAFLVTSSFTPTMLAGNGVIVAGLIVWFVLSLMLSAAVVLAVDALFDRGDLDLLIASPVPTRSVFAVRGVGVALGAVALFAAIALPFANMGIVNGSPQLIAVYPVFAGLALGIAGVAFALTLVLVRMFGARRARVFAQILSALIGAGMFFAFQIPNIVPEEVRARWVADLQSVLTSGWLDPESILWWPARALLGEPWPSLAVIALGVVVFVLVIGVTGRIFLAGTQESVTKSARPAGPGKAMRFRQGLARTVMRKELKLIARDPNLIAKTLLQSLYLVPMIVIFTRNNSLMQVLGPAIVLLFAGVAGNLAWITIAGEEAPDLVGSAPVERERVRWLKAAAALAPLGVCALPFVAIYFARSPLGGVLFAGFLAIGLTASAVTQVWGGKPAASRDLKLRQKQNVGLGFMEVLGTMAIAGACFLALSGSWWSLVILPLGCIGPAAAWGMRQNTTA